MIRYEKMVKLNNLMDKRIELNDDIEQISNTLLSGDLLKQTRDELLYELKCKIKEYEQVLDALGNFKFE